MRTVTATELAKGTSEILDRVDDGQVVAVTRRESPRKTKTVAYMVHKDFYSLAVAALVAQADDPPEDDQDRSGTVGPVADFIKALVLIPDGPKGPDGREG